MAPRDMKAALTASLHAEHQAVQARLAKADAYFQTQEAHTGQAAAPSPAPEKVIRDGFTMPADDYALIAQLQASGLQAGVAVSKSEVYVPACMPCKRCPQRTSVRCSPP